VQWQLFKAAAASSAARVSARNDSVWRKNNPLVEPRGERCYSSQESSLQGMASEQSRIFFAFAVHLSAKFDSLYGEKVKIAIL